MAKKTVPITEGKKLVMFKRPDEIKVGTIIENIKPNILNAISMRIEQGYSFVGVNEVPCVLHYPEIDQEFFRVLSEELKASGWNLGVNKEGRTLIFSWLPIIEKRED